MIIIRGDIFYIYPSLTCGSEQHAGRPAIVVSNEKCNEHSPVVEVVYLTSREKSTLPTHVEIASTGRQSIALCEQISSVSTDRFGDYIGHVSDLEMKSLNRALAISLGLTDPEAILSPKSGSAEEEALMVKVALKYVENYIHKKSCSSKE